MKKVALGFLRRGVMSCGAGPIVLAVLYLILHHNGVVENISVKELCVVGYLVIWAVIYFVIKRKTKNLNEMLKEKQKSLTLFQDY